jgi:hypothetical protein
MSVLLFTTLLFMPAQQIALDEDFESGIFPPVGWSENNNGNSLGWEDSGTGAAFHDDFVGLNDNYLITPSMDFSSFAQAYLHGIQGSKWTTYRDLNTVELSLDGGLTFATIYTEQTIGDGSGQALEIDLTSYSGIADVILAWRYYGDFGNEWSIEDVLIDDEPYTPPQRWSQFPTTWRTANGFNEDFETLAGVVDTYLGVNMVDMQTREPESRGFCNIGQLAPSTYKKGSYSLEMGLQPGDPGLHYVANGLMIGLDGSGSNRLWLEMEVMNHGEELNTDDGVFLSNDGENWAPVLYDWDLATGGFLNLGLWNTVRVPLFVSTVDTSIPFYMIISQADNRPYASYDGLTVDNIRILSEPLLSVTGAGAGGVNTLLVNHLQPGARVAALYSLAGPGPSGGQYGIVNLSKPIHSLGTFTVDASGELVLTGTVPASMAGVEVWLQAVQSWQGLRINSNQLDLILS